MPENIDDRAILLDRTGRDIVKELYKIGSALRGEKGLIYGFHINGSESNPESAVTYIEQATGFTPAKMNFESGQFEWGSWADAFFLPRPCMVKYDGTVDYYLNPNDYSKKADGFTGSDIANTDYQGNAMMEWGKNGKKIWMKTVPSSDRKSVSVYIADEQIDKDYHDWSFINSAGVEVDHFYTPIYNGSLVDGKMRSISGQLPIHNTNVTQEVSYATANNLDGRVQWYTEVFSDVTLINALLILMGKSLDTQSVYGYGQATYDSSETTYYGIAASGTMNNKGMFWGDRDGKPDTPGDPCGVKVFGMEHWWGNLWRRYAGHIMVGGVHKYKMTYGTQDGSTAASYNQSGEGYINAGNAPFVDSGNGYVKEMRYEPTGAMLTAAVGGSSSQYYCDYFYWNAGITAYACRGGDVSSGSYMGAFYVYLNGWPSDTAWHIGAGVSLKPLA